MTTQVKCPSCKASELVLEQYYSLTALGNGQALFLVRCPRCNKMTRVVERIPASLVPEVNRVAHEVQAGMGGAGRASG